jgi:hypothetical protein
MAGAMSMYLKALTWLLIAAEAGAAPPPAGKCFDLAVIAGPPRETVIAGSSDPDDLIGHPSWMLDIKVDRILLGSEKRKRIRAIVVKHAGLNPDIK